MSTLLRMLLAAFAALAVSVAAWAGLCAAGVEHARLASGPPPPLPTAPADSPIAALPRVSPTTEASVGRSGSRRARLDIALRGRPAIDDLVVTVFDGFTAAPIASAPLDPAALAAGRIAFEAIPFGQHRLTLSRGTAGARHSYLTAIDVRAGGDDANPDLDATVEDLLVTARDDRGVAVANVVIVAERIDDPAWRCPAAQAGMAHTVTDAAGQTRLGPLGVGRYRVRALLTDAPAVEVDFPSLPAATITLRAAR